MVADSRLRTPLTAAIVRSAYQVPSWILYHTDSLPEGTDPAAFQPGEIIPSRAQKLAEAGARCVLVPAGEGGIDLPQALRALGTRGLTRVLAEGGAGLAASLLRADLVDRIVWFHAPAAMGGDGLAALGPLGVSALGAMPRFVRLGAPVALGSDVMSVFARAG